MSLVSGLFHRFCSPAVLTAAQTCDGATSVIVCVTSFERAYKQSFLPVELPSSLTYVVCLHVYIRCPQQTAGNLCLSGASLRRTKKRTERKSASFKGS